MTEQSVHTHPGLLGTYLLIGQRSSRVCAGYIVRTHLAVAVSCNDVALWLWLETRIQLFALTRVVYVKSLIFSLAWWQRFGKTNDPKAQQIERSSISCTDIFLVNRIEWLVWTETGYFGLQRSAGKYIISLWLIVHRNSGVLVNQRL